MKKPFRNAAIMLSLVGSLGACSPRKVNVDADPDAGPAPDISLADSSPGYDKGPQPDNGAVPDAGQKPPEYSFTIKGLINDYIDSQLLDREDSAGYGFDASETSQNANPFSDGAGGNIGVAVLGMHRVDGSMFPEFAPRNLHDPESNGQYVEQQDFWIRGHSAYSEDAQDVVGHVDWLAITVKFHGAADELGIPVCSNPSQSDYSACKDSSTASPDATERHRFHISLLGDDWLVAGMEPPVGQLSDENTVVPGGSVRLIQMKSRGLIRIDEALLAEDGLMFKLTGFGGKDGSDMAEVSVMDTGGAPVTDPQTGAPMKLYLEEGQTTIVSINGKDYKLHAYGVDPNAQEAELIFVAKELLLEHGKGLDEQNKHWKVLLGWKNKGASASDTRPDHLRTIALFADDIEKISTSGSRKLMEGDSIPIVNDPANLELQFNGLTEGGPDTLRYELVKNNYLISSQSGPGHKQCTIDAPHVKVSSTAWGHVFTIPGAGDNEFLVATSGGDCGDVPFDEGTVFIKESPSTDRWVKLDYQQYLNVEYSILRDGSPAMVDGKLGTGHIVIATDGGVLCPSQKPDFVFQMIENTGKGASLGYSARTNLGLKLNGALSSFNIDVINPPEYACNLRKDHVSYEQSGPVATGRIQAGEGFISERGTRFVEMTDDKVEFEVGETIVYSQFTLVKK